MRWGKVEVEVEKQLQGPGKRWGHTCNAIKGGRFLYVFGGYGQHNCQTNQVHVFDTVNQLWSQPVIKGVPPTPRDSHSCTTVGDNLYVFGGTDGMSPLKDLHILDTSSHTWISPSVRGEGPEAREGHSAALVGRRLFIFGGCGKSSDNNDEVYYNDIYILNTETFMWKRAATSGTPPSARDSHTCSSWKNKIIVIGGEDGHDYYLSDVHILDTDTLTWKQLKTGGQMLSPRAGHATVALGKNLFVFGGFTDSQNLYDDLYMLDVETGFWTKVMTIGEGPSARFSVAGDCLDPLKSGVLVFIGGCNKSLEALDDMYYLYTGLSSERKLEKLSLKKQLKLKCQEQNLISPPDRALIRIETSHDVSQPIPLASYVQPRNENFSFNGVPQGKKSFQAKLTESFPLGYTIETTIDGKPLRGILFANNPSSVNPISYNFSRKRVAGDVILNGDCDNEQKDTKTIRQEEAFDQSQIDGVQGKELTSFHPSLTVSDTKSPTGSDNCLGVKSPVNPQPSVTHLNLNEERSNNTANSAAEVSKETNCSVEKDPAKLYDNQDDKALSTEGNSNPAQSF